MIFYFLFCILFFLSFIYYSGKKYPLTQTAYLSFCVFLLFLIIAGGRNNVGTDWWQYKETFDNYVIDHNYVHASLEVLFYGFTGFIASFSKSFNVFVFFLFLLSFFLKYRFIVNNSSNVFFAFLIYLSGVFLIFDVNGLRQGLAIGFILYSCKFIFSRNIWGFLFMIILATLSHSSAIVFFPAYFLLNIQYSTKKYVIFCLILSLLGYWVSLCVGDLLVLLTTDSTLAEKYNYYSSGDSYVSKVSLFSVSTLRRFALYGVVLYFTRNKIDTSTYFFKNCMVVYFLFFFLFSSSLEMAYRISYYFFVFEIVLVPYCITCIHHVKFRYCFLLVMGSYYLYMIYKLVSVPTGGLYIYHNIFLN